MINTQIKELMGTKYEQRFINLTVKNFLKLVHKKVLSKDEITKEKVDAMISYFEKDIDYEYKKYIR
ncbi:hypothetical protein AAA294_02235 [Fusobacterium varium]|uniref:hypothetical protein n=1 Tax=Fusobacterium varium TaxID=856 RepID=UPI0032C0B01E